MNLHIPIKLPIAHDKALCINALVLAGDSWIYLTVF